MHIYDMLDNSLQLKGKLLNFLLRLYVTTDTGLDKMKNAITLASMSKMFGFSPGRPDLRRIFKYMIEHNMLLSEEKTYFGFSKHYINKKLLWKFLQTQDVIKLYERAMYHRRP